MKKTKEMTRVVALLRGINVGGNRKVPMADLKTLAETLGFANVATFIQSGNLVFDTKGSPPEATRLLESAIKKRFGFAVDVIMRTAAQWAVYAAGSPFPDAQAAHPNHLLLSLSKEPPRASAAETLRERAADGERIEVVGDAIWLDFPDSMGKTKLSPSVIDKAVGSPVTGRNWKTVTTLNEMLQAQE